MTHEEAEPIARAVGRDSTDRIISILYGMGLMLTPNRLEQIELAIAATCIRHLKGEAECQSNTSQTAGGS